MRRRKSRWRYGWVGLGLVLAMAAVAVSSRMLPAGSRHDPGRWKDLPRATVRRADLWVTVTSGGLVQSADKKAIECELQSMDAGVNGNRLSVGGASTILSLLPEGTLVKKGDVLCRLDSSAYEEVLRQQEMTVERSKADHEQAKLNLEVAKMAISEFRDGTRVWTLKDMQGRIALAEAEGERMKDRLAWSRRMLAKGYLSSGQVAAEIVAQTRAAFSLEQSKMNSDIYRRYQVPRTLRELENAVTAAEATFTFQTARLTRNLDRLATLKRQIEKCTIRAPHDGLVIYANDPWRRYVLEEGMTVRQKQPLFYLPDLSQMEVSSLLHETVVDHVRKGMRAKIRIEGLSNRILEGHVVSIAELPTKDQLSSVPYYSAAIKIDSIPKGLRPGMTAEVEISTQRRSDVLTIPSNALTVENGRDVCYVADQDGLRRREVTIGQSSRDELEVTGGLNEGEQVVLDPGSTLESGAEPASGALAEADADEPADTAPASATH